MAHDEKSFTRPERRLAKTARHAVEALEARRLLSSAVNPLPPGTAGMTIDLGADQGVTTDGGGQVTLWSDQSGAGNNASPPSAGPLLTTTLVNGVTRPALQFNGTSQFLTAGIQVPASGTLFAVYNNSDTSGIDRRLIGWEDSLVGNNGIAIIPDTTGSLAVVARNAGAAGDVQFSGQPASTTMEADAVSWGSNGVTVMRVLADGTMLQSNNAAITSISNGGYMLHIGAAGDNGFAKFEGELADLQAFDTQLSAATQSSELNYLYETWIAPASSAAQLAFTAVPSSVVPGAVIGSAVTVAVEDANNSPVSTDTSTITLAIATGPAGAVLGGSLTATAVNGVATFSNLSFSLPGAYTLQATDAALTPALSATVTTFTPSTIGGLDPSFGVNGLAAHNVGFTATAGLVVQGDGKSVIAGTGGSPGAGAFGITRYNADGTLDTTFGANGVTITALPGDAQATAELLLSNGDIVVAGTDTTLVNGQSTGSQFALAEYTSAGMLDTTFGNGAGYVLTSFSATAGTLSNDAARALAVGPDGTIYVGGSSDAAGHGQDFAIAAYTSSGAPSSSFGTNGQVLLDFMGGDDSIGALTFGLKGALIAAGSATDPSSGVSSVALAEFLPTGALNTKFGAKGKLTTSVGGVDDAASALAIGAKGAIVVGGYTGTGSASAGTLSSNFLLLRYDSAGKLDKTFGNGGIVTTSFNQPAAITNLLIGPTGTIVASGKSAASLAGLDVSQLELAAARYTEKGRLDTSYDGVGQAIYNLSTAVTTASLTSLPGGNEQPAIATATAIPFDATSDLMAAFMQLTQSDQGVIAMTSGGDLLDAANNGANTVEAAIVSMGLDLAATLNASLPASIIGGGKGTASVNIAEAGTELAAGTFTIELFASSIASQPAGQAPFQTFPEKLTLKEGMAKALKLKFQYPSSLSKGNYYLVATVDTGSARDLNIGNNTSASTSTVLIAPAFVQLSGSALTAPTFNGAKPVSVSITLANAGNETANATAAVQFFAATTGTPTGAMSLATTPLKLNLKPNAAHLYKLKLALPATLSAGTYMLVALLDPANIFSDPNAALNFIVSGNTFVVA